MKAASRFLRLGADAPRATVFVGAASYELRAGENLAAELLAAGVSVFRRTPVSGAPRSPYCMMGACFDCLVEVDGVVRQACMIEVTEGMVIGMPPIPQAALDGRAARNTAGQDMHDRGEPHA